MATGLWQGPGNRRGGSPRGTEVIEENVEQLSTELSSLATLRNPDAIFVGGTLGYMPEEFVQLLHAQSRRFMSPLRDVAQVRRSSLGLNAGTIGGATTTLDRYFYA